MTSPAKAMAVSTYSFWRYRAEKLPVENCVDLATEMGFDAIEIFEKQMHRKDDAHLQLLKRQAFVAGLSICGMSTHQDFISPRPADRRTNVETLCRSAYPSPNTAG